MKSKFLIQVSNSFLGQIRSCNIYFIKQSVVALRLYNTEILGDVKMW